jgi:hypothetical protein
MGEFISNINMRRAATAAAIAVIGPLSASPASAESLAHAKDYRPTPVERVRESNNFNWLSELALLHILLVDEADKNQPAHQQKHRHLTPAQIARREVTPEEFREWSKVNVCEESGNWHVEGDEYRGGLGISNRNWVIFGGLKFAPNAAVATPDEQIVVAEHIQPNPPDQNGCDGGW